MPVTTNDAALKAHILASPDLSPLVTSGDYQVIADALNAAADPAWTVWRTSVTRDDCQSDGFDWVQVDNLTNGQARIWEWLFDPQSQTMRPSEPGKRAGISECWKGTAAKVAVATFVLNKCKRSATRAEKVLSTGTGSYAVPATVGWEGSISAFDIGPILSA